MTQLISPVKFTKTVGLLRSFFLAKGFQEVHTQNRLSILAACEDPFNVATYNYAGQVWPLPQTGQMWLEYELLKNPEAPGYFCQSTSYRQEPNPTEGRHDLIFPLFEFEMHGGMDDLIKMEKELLTYLGYDFRKFMSGKYSDVAKEYGTEELEHEHEERLSKEKSPVAFITDFPEFTSPFWNMRRNPNDDTSYKVDVILSGMETFGSAEREVDKDVMRAKFESIMEGSYKNKLFELFGEERTVGELEEYFQLNFIKRSGCGIGLTRLIKSMDLENLLD